MLRRVWDRRAAREERCSWYDAPSCRHACRTGGLAVRAFDAPLIVHSHLRWDFVWQRPQQLLSRFAESVPVLFVEEPLFADDVSRGRLEFSTPTPNVTRAVPVL